MKREEFCDVFWEYYLSLEKDFMDAERYVYFDLGDNNLYDGKISKDTGNSLTFSVEFVKQYQAICSEVDIILNAICNEIRQNVDNKITEHTKIILSDNFWCKVVMQKVKFKDIELQPFMNWTANPYKSPDWWTPSNNVKHDRTHNYKKANLKNVTNSLAGLYILENYLAKYIGDRDKVRDVPSDTSKIFEMVSWKTKDIVLGKNSYAVRFDEIEDLKNL